RSNDSNVCRKGAQDVDEAQVRPGGQYRVLGGQHNRWRRRQCTGQALSTSLRRSSAKEVSCRKRIGYGSGRWWLKLASVAVSRKVPLHVFVAEVGLGSGDCY